jgi:DNA transposition AAA+ family ATPase
MFLTGPIAAITRTTNGNFHLIQRLFTQIHRILDINRLQTITAEVVDAARETLVIGLT